MFIRFATKFDSIYLPFKIAKNASSLHFDYVSTNILDLSVTEPGTLQCTSCKSAEIAISRCNDCANFLCACCDKAHKYMRCFENHHVVILDDLRNSAEKFAIHKPLFCTTHTSENLKYYCFKCQVPICNDCVIGDHKGSEHHYESINEAEKRMRLDIKDLMANAKKNIMFCDEASISLENALSDLQTQHDVASDLINETYKRFRAILDSCRDNASKELERLHSERELKIMELMHTVEKSVEKTETACKFTSKVLQHANATEFLSLKYLISSQFLNLISNTPKVDVSYSLKFENKAEKFEQVAQEIFGKFRTESTPPSPKESTPPPSLPGLPPAVNKSNIPCNSSQGALTNSVTASSPISLPTSMQSSFDGDVSALSTNFMIPSGNPITSEAGATSMHPPSLSNLSLNFSNSSNNSVNNNLLGNGSVQTPIGSNTPLSVMPTISEFNLHRLVNFGDSTDVTDAMMPQPSPSPVSQLTLADLISDRNFNNIQALCKLGLNQGLNSNGLCFLFLFVSYF